ncbi:MAG: hypothetical protein IJ697_05635 [Synergistaceae bacterium]|nr:hypothetical protein [Synergistaceae bacterium]
MYHKRRVLSFALLLLLLSAGASFAVTVTGHDGTSLPLSQIPDIIRHVTGRTSEDFHMRKDTLFVYDTNNTNFGTHSVYTFNPKGENEKVGSVSDSVRLLVVDSNYEKIAAVDTSVTNKDGGRLTLLFNDLGAAATFVTNNGNGSVNIDRASSMGSISAFSDNDFADERKKQVHLLDAKSGISVKGYDGDELVAFLERRVETVLVRLGKAAAPFTRS